MNLDERFRAEGWGLITDQALGIAPADVESQAREVARWAHQKIASLEAENARLREQVARDEGDAATMRGFIATHGCTPSMMYSRAVVAERQLAEARRLLKEAVPTVAKIRDSMATHWLERVAALAPAEKPGSDGEGT